MRFQSFRKNSISVVLGLGFLFAAFPAFSQNEDTGFPDPRQDNFYQQYSAWMERRVENFENFFSDDTYFSDSEDFFKEMIDMRRELLEEMRKNQTLLDSLPKKTLPKTTLHQEGFREISREEKDGKLLITLEVPDLDQGAVKVEARQQYLLLTRQMTQHQQNGPMAGVFTSQFQKTIPLPPGADPNGVQYRKENDRIIVEVPLGGPGIPSVPQPKVHEQI